MTSDLDIAQIAEGCDLECKLAAGRGELPESCFATYSAMANTDGGVVLRGVKEKPPGGFTVQGVVDHEKVRADLWNLRNNRQKVSANLLADGQVQPVAADGRTVIRARITRASRHHRPVYLNGNPLGNTFRRNHAGDYKCYDATVRRVLAEQVEDARDARVLHGFGMDDLDPGTLAAYRNQMRAARPDHPFLAESDRDLLRQLGGWGRDRDDGREGLTLAGVTMFGRFRPILEVLPHYQVDYQEWVGSLGPADRWSHRETTDGTWSGNLYDFYRRVSVRLTADLPVPFRLQKSTRVDNTPIHDALREALVNALIHADYAGRASVLVVKRPDLFGFRNPGTMRVPVEQALRGGTSDCRNPSLRIMFQLAGWGEKAGSGVPTVHRNWQQADWRLPQLWDEAETDQTFLLLWPVSLLPAETVDELRRRFGDHLDRLSEAQRLTLAAVAVEGWMSHARMKSRANFHSADLSKQLADLVGRGFLDADGYSHGRRYFFLGESDRATGETLDADIGLRPFGGDLFSHLRPPMNPVPNGFGDDPLRRIAAAIRDTERASPDAVRECLLRLCAVKPLSRQELAQLLERNPDQLRINYLTPLVREGRLTLLHPDNKSHPAQKYTTAPAPEDAS
jgi:predicted HTH transcriptional regulator